MLMDVYPACDQSCLHHNSGRITSYGIRHAVERLTGIMRHQTSIPENARHHRQSDHDAPNG